MQLRTHPKMKWEGFSNWPPVWAGSLRSCRCLPYGRGGCANRRRIVEANYALPRHLALRMDQPWATLGSADPLR